MLVWLSAYRDSLENLDHHIGGSAIIRSFIDDLVIDKASDIEVQYHRSVAELSSIVELYDVIADAIITEKHADESEEQKARLIRSLSNSVYNHLAPLMGRGFIALPDELLVSVFKYFNPTELVRALRVNRRINQFILTCPELFPDSWHLEVTGVDKDEMRLNQIKQKLQDAKRAYGEVIKSQSTFTTKGEETTHHLDKKLLRAIVLDSYAQTLQTLQVIERIRQEKHNNGEAIVYRDRKKELLGPQGIFFSRDCAVTTVKERLGFPLYKVIEEVRKWPQDIITLAVRINAIDALRAILEFCSTLKLWENSLFDTIASVTMEEELSYPTFDKDIWPSLIEKPTFLAVKLNHTHALALLDEHGVRISEEASFNVHFAKCLDLDYLAPSLSFFNTSKFFLSPYQYAIECGQIESAQYLFDQGARMKPESTSLIWDIYEHATCKYNFSTCTGESYVLVRKRCFDNIDRLPEGLVDAKHYETNKTVLEECLDQPWSYANPRESYIVNAFILRSLLRARVDVNQVSKDGETAFLKCIRFAMHTRWNKVNSSVRVRMFEGLSPVSGEETRLGLLRQIAPRVKNINEHSRHHKDTVLHLVALSEQVNYHLVCEMLEILLKHGANPHAKNTYSQTPLKSLLKLSSFVKAPSHVSKEQNKAKQILMKAMQETSKVGGKEEMSPKK